MTALASGVGQNERDLYRFVARKTLIYTAVAGGTLCDYIITFPAIRFERWMSAIMITAFLQSIVERFLLTKKGGAAVRKMEAYALSLVVEKGSWAGAIDVFIKFVFPYFSLYGLSLLLERGEISCLPSHIFRHYISEIFRYAVTGGTIACVLQWFFPLKMKIDAFSLGTIRNTFVQAGWGGGGVLRRFSNFAADAGGRVVSSFAGLPGLLTEIVEEEDLSEEESLSSDQSSPRESLDGQSGFDGGDSHVRFLDRSVSDIPDEKEGEQGQGPQQEGSEALQRQVCRTESQLTAMSGRLDVAEEASDESDIAG